MIVIGSSYYHSMTTILSVDRVNEIVQIENETIPEGGVVRGTSREGGVSGLLMSANFYPVGTNSVNVRMCVILFDSLPAQVNDSTKPWRIQRERVVRYYAILSDLIVHPLVQNSSILGKNRDISKRFGYHKNVVAALLVGRGWYGDTTKAYSMDLLWKMGENRPENHLVHYMGVCPTVMFLVTEMNPYGELGYETIMKMDLRRIENNVKNYIKNFPTWSHDEALRRAKLPPGHVDALTFRDEPMCSGWEVTFVRMLSLIVPEFVAPTFTPGTRTLESTWLTDKEKSRFYEGYDEFVTLRQPRPKNPMGMK